MRPSHSIAAGMAVLAIGAAAWVVGSGLSALVPEPEAGAAEPACATPVEIVEPEGVRVGCVDELDACGLLGRGAAVAMDGSGCRVLPDGMSAGTRLLYGVPIDLNRASAADLEMLPGLGPKLAAAIVAERQAHGPFGGFGDLTRVRGIGMATAVALEPYVITE